MLDTKELGSLQNSEAKIIGSWEDPASDRNNVNERIVQRLIRPEAICYFEPIIY